MRQKPEIRKKKVELRITSLDCGKEKEYLRNRRKRIKEITA